MIDLIRTMNFCEKSYSEKEIREYIKNHPEELNSIFWRDLSFFQTLSKEFIRDFHDQLYWSCISRWQNLSEEFLIEFIEKVDVYKLSLNEKIPEDVKQRILNLKKVIDQ